jgi:ribosome-associated protein
LPSLSPLPLAEPASADIPEESRVAARAADAKSGGETTVLAMGELLCLTDAFVITSGGNTRQVKTIVDQVEREVKEACGLAPVRVEGLDDARWVLMDYGDFLVHVFLDEARDFYDLEHLWADAPRVRWQTD